MTCKNCYHFNACLNENENTYLYFPDREDITEQEVEKCCSNFKNTDQIIELPCKMGTPLYIVFRRLKKYYRPDEKCVIIRRTRLSPCNMEQVIAGFGKTYFLTRAEAEAEMEKMKQESRDC